MSRQNEPKTRLELLLAEQDRPINNTDQLIAIIQKLTDSQKTEVLMGFAQPSSYAGNRHTIFATVGAAQPAACTEDAIKADIAQAYK